MFKIKGREDKTEVKNKSYGNLSILTKPVGIYAKCSPYEME